MDNKTPQLLANLIQAYGQVINAARELYINSDLRNQAIDISLSAQSGQLLANEALKSMFNIDYFDNNSNTKIIKEGSQVTVLVDHIDGMIGSKAIIRGYSSPAMISDITMPDGMVMKAHKWLINSEVKLNNF